VIWLSIAIVLGVVLVARREYVVYRRSHRKRPRSRL